MYYTIVFFLVQFYVRDNNFRFLCPLSNLLGEIKLERNSSPYDKVSVLCLVKLEPRDYVLRITCFNSSN